MKEKGPITFEDAKIAARSYKFNTMPNACWRRINAIIESEDELSIEEAASALQFILKVSRDQIIAKLEAFPPAEHDTSRVTGPFEAVQ